jgi:nicotinamide-nucleotide amidase
MRCAVVSVGKEVLTGFTVNTNLTIIARKLRTIGIDINRNFVIDDQFEEFHKILPIIDEKLLIFTGGLGPTIDDITKEAVFSYFKVPTFVDKNIIDTIKSRFDHINKMMHTSNEKQALRPIDSISLTNPNGTAPGVYFEAQGKIIVLLPGPPHELNPMVDQVLNLIQTKQKNKLYSDGFFLSGIGESEMEHKLLGFYEKHPLVNIAPYASIGEIKYIFTSSSKDALKDAMNDFESQFHNYIYGSLEDTLESVVVRLLQKQHKIISMAESCTGGLLASTIVNVPGSSEVFKEGLVVYSNEAKMKYLHVSEETLKIHGAVSYECVKELAINLQKETKADVGVGISGIAGPTGGTKEKPVGLVYFCIRHQSKTLLFEKIFNGDRMAIRHRAVKFILNELKKELQQDENHIRK